MSKILYANGCSWTYGNGINKDPILKHHSRKLTDQVHFAWPAKLARLLKYTCLNDSLGGGSNARIVRTTCDYLMRQDPEQLSSLLIVIGWTTPCRNEVYVNADENTTGWYRFNVSQKFSEHQSNSRASTGILQDLDKFHETYVANMYDEQIAIMYCLQQKFLLSNTLDNLGVKYLFFDSLSTMWHPTNEEPHTFTINKIRTNKMLTNPTFSNFMNENKIPLSSCLHPMIQGHSEWAKYLYGKLIEIYGDEVHG